MNIDDIRDAIITCRNLLIEHPSHHYDDKDKPRYVVWEVVREVHTRLDECILHFDKAVHEIRKGEGE